MSRSMQNIKPTLVKNIKPKLKDESRIDISTEEGDRTPIEKEDFVTTQEINANHSSKDNNK